MKKITLVVVGLLLMSNATEAAAKRVNAAKEEGYRFLANFRDADPIIFSERGIEFYLFLDGQFDFNTAPTTGGSIYYRRPNNTNMGGPRTNVSSSSFYGPTTGVRIEHDYQGRVRRIGNVFINYDAFGRVKRIGSVYMKYNSFALKQVGNLKIFYNRRGQVSNMVGFVNFANQDCNYSFHGNYNNLGYNNYNPNAADDFYFYRKDGTREKMSEEDIREIKQEELELERKR